MKRRNQQAMGLLVLAWVSMLLWNFTPFTPAPSAIPPYGPPPATSGFRHYTRHLLKPESWIGSAHEQGKPWNLLALATDVANLFLLGSTVGVAVGFPILGKRLVLRRTLAGVLLAGLTLSLIRFGAWVWRFNLLFGIDCVFTSGDLGFLGIRLGIICQFGLLAASLLLMSHAQASQPPPPESRLPPSIR